MSKKCWGCNWHGPMLYYHFCRLREQHGIEDQINPNKDRCDQYTTTKTCWIYGMTQ